jgi:integrase/recombinase XerD
VKSGRRDSNPRQPAWKAGTLPTELLPQNRTYFNPKIPSCQKGVPAFPSSKARLSNLIGSYRLCARAEGKRPKTIDTVTSSVTYLEKFLVSQGLATEANSIGPDEIRAFILYLQQKRRFTGHPYTYPQQDGLSLHSINSYLRSIRAFWSWLTAEGVVEQNVFTRVRIPKAPVKVIPTFSEEQLNSMISAINGDTPGGFRDLTAILTLLDTGMRISELAGLRLDDMRLDEGILKVIGKGNKERLIPIGRNVRRLLWKYISLVRPDPATPRVDAVFLTADGRPIGRQLILHRMTYYGKKVGLRGVRCSPHTLRHTAALSFLRNGGDVFSLQRLLGHSSLAMTRHYCELADVDVRQAHSKASPVDNLPIATTLSRPKHGPNKSWQTRW